MNILLLKVFVASSSELNLEREKTISFLNSINKQHDSIRLEPVMWETDIESGSYDGSRIQDEINETLKESDIVIFFFYSKIGQYTFEEYSAARKLNKKIFIYFKKGFSPEKASESDEYTKLLKFKEDLSKEAKILYKEYRDIISLENLIKTDINMYIQRKIDKEPNRQGSTNEESQQLQESKEIYMIGDMNLYVENNDGGEIHVQ